MQSDGKGWNKELINNIFIKSEVEAIMKLPISLIDKKDEWYGSIPSMVTILWKKHRDG